MEKTENASIRHWTMSETGEMFIYAVIILNSVVMYMQAGGNDSPTLATIDLVTNIIFVIEMCVRWKMMGTKGYWSNGWCRMDGILVLLSIPSIINYFVPIPASEFAILLVIRLFRGLRFFRFMHLIRGRGDGLTRLAEGFVRAIKASSSVLATFLVLIIVLGLINCEMFGHVAPQYFGTPTSAIYSVFRLFTIEGWYEIPDDVVAGFTSPYASSLIYAYFCFILIVGGIIGMSFINSVFVDAMVEDNNDDVMDKLNELEQKIDRLQRLLDKNSKQA